MGQDARQKKPSTLKKTNSGNLWGGRRGDIRVPHFQSYGVARKEV